MGTDLVAQQLIPAQWSGMLGTDLTVLPEGFHSMGESGRAKAEGAAIAKAKAAVAILRILVFIVVVSVVSNGRDWPFCSVKHHATR